LTLRRGGAEPDLTAMIVRRRAGRHVHLGGVDQRRRIDEIV
jgi:hypothetical protein